MKLSNFQRVSAMNTAFGNPKGNAAEIDFERVRKQCLNIADEFGELMFALGADETLIKAAITHLKWVASRSTGPVDLDLARDALCDIHVFDYGAHHLMGIDADADMAAVVDGVMTRFIKDDADKASTIAKHAAAGVVDVYFEGEYPTMVMKSASDQPDAPRGKFLKSASYSEPALPPIE
jgi:predicted HAD superfamily Cof-like phosphohydrolase